MKFKKDPQDAEVRNITLVDNEGDRLDVETWHQGRYKLILRINEENSFGLKKEKALKLAWAIIDSSPSVLVR